MNTVRVLVPIHVCLAYGLNMESLEGTAGTAHASAAADAPEYGGAVDTRGVRRADGNGGGAVADAADTCRHGSDCRSERSASAISKTFCCSDCDGTARRADGGFCIQYRAEPAGRMYLRPRPIHRQVTQDDVCPLACAAVRLERVHTAASRVERRTSQVHQSRQSIRLGSTLDIE